jgi:hypothetical protein
LFIGYLPQLQIGARGIAAAQNDDADLRAHPATAEFAALFDQQTSVFMPPQCSPSERQPKQ